MSEPAPQSPPIDKLLLMIDPHMDAEQSIHPYSSSVPGSNPFFITSDESWEFLPGLWQAPRQLHRDDEITPMLGPQSIAILLEDPPQPDPHRSTVQLIGEPDSLENTSGVGKIQPRSEFQQPHSTSGEPPQSLMTVGQPVVLERLQPDTYMPVSLLGRGGQGEVYEAVHEELQRKVALKVPWAMDEHLGEFLAECMILARLDHPNIVPIYSIGLRVSRGEKRPVLAMKKISGTNWRCMMRKDWGRSIIPSEEFLNKHLEILLQVLNALSYAHSQGVIHRDFKPAQVMVGEYGEVYLGDWGLAVVLTDLHGLELTEGVELSDSMISLGKASGMESGPLRPKKVGRKMKGNTPAGTPAYMAPEQIMGNTAILSEATDVYLVGSVLHELLTGKPPHSGKNMQAVIQNVVINKIAPLSEEVPEDLAALTMQCLETNPANRPGSVVQVAEVLRNYLTGYHRKTKGRKMFHAVGEEIDQATNYVQLSEIAERLSRAVAYYPEFPMFPALHDSLLGRYFRVAMNTGDLSLARFQLNRIQDDQVRELLRQEVEAKTAQLHKQLRKSLRPDFWSLLMVLVVLAIIVGLRSLLLAHYSADLGVGALKHGATVAAMGAESLEQNDLDEILRNPDRNSIPFYRSSKALTALLVGAPKTRRVSAYTLEPNGTWALAVDTSRSSQVALLVNGVVSQQQLLPGHKGVVLPEIALEALRTRRPMGMLGRTGNHQLVSFGFAPVLHTESPKPTSIVEVEIPMPEIGVSLMKMEAGSLFAAIGLAALVSGMFLAIMKSRRSAQAVTLLTKRLEQQESTFNSQHINLG